jgi:hypothetical protein
MHFAAGLLAVAVALSSVALGCGGDDEPGPGPDSGPGLDGAMDAPADAPADAVTTATDPMHAPPGDRSIGDDPSADDADCN